MASDIPMPNPTVSQRPLTSFKVMSFDIYGTLVDWETSLVHGLQPLVSRIPAESSFASFRNSKEGKGRIELASRFNDYEHELQASKPDLRYDLLLTETYIRMAKDWDIPVTQELEKEAESFGQSISSWSAFPDTVEACRRLSKHYKLLPLSNVDRQSFAKTCLGALKDVDFWKVYTAQDIGTYKPDPRNFEYLIKHVKEDGGFEKDEILHTAQSLFHDHRPAKDAGLSSVWINRQGAGMGNVGGVKEIHDQGLVGYGWRFETLGQLADEVDREFTKAR